MFKANLRANGAQKSIIPHYKKLIFLLQSYCPITRPNSTVRSPHGWTSCEGLTGRVQALQVTSGAPEGFHFLLNDYEEAQGGGRLDKESTLAMLQLTTLKYMGVSGLVPVSFGPDGLSLMRILAGTTFEVSGQGPASVPIAPDPSYASRHVLDGLQRLASVLASVELDAEYLVLPEHLPVELPQPLRTNIFVRRAYRRVIPRLRITYGGMRAEPSNGSHNASLDGAEFAVGVGAAGARGVPQIPRTLVFLGHVLTGPPGCGKSSIAPLVIAHLAQHRKPVLYKYFSPRSLEQYIKLDFTTCPPCVDIEYTETPERLAAYMRSSQTWLLWDGPLPKGSGKFNGDGPMLVMSSSDDKDHHEFVKGKGAAVMHMNAFSLYEFLKVAPLYGVSPSAAVDRYRIFGGCIRPALVKLEEETEATLRMSVSDRDARELLDLSLVGTRSRMSHTLVHLMSDHDFKPKHLGLASPVVREIVYESFGFRHNLKKLELLVLEGTRQEDFAGLAGCMFEQCGHFVLPEGAMHVHMRQLHPNLQQMELSSKSAWGSEGKDAPGAGVEAAGGMGSMEGDDNSEEEQASHHVPISDPMEAASGAPGACVAGQASGRASQLQQLGTEAGSVHLPKVQRVWDSPEKDVSELQHVYLQPPTANNASWDAYYAHGDQRYVLQYIVSPRRGVKQAPIQKLLLRLGLSADKVKLVFVVPAQPASLYDTLSWQPWQGVKDSTLGSGSWLQMEQWVMKLPVAPQPGQSRSPSRGNSISQTAGTT